MNALKIIATTAGCGLVGAVVGSWRGSKDPGDTFGVSIFIFAAEGLFIGGVIGVVAGSFLFA